MSSKLPDLPRRKPAISPLPAPEPLSRRERGRLRREKAVEQGFRWVFYLAVLLLVAYMIGHSPWLAALIQWAHAL